MIATPVGEFSPVPASLAVDVNGTAVPVVQLAVSQFGYAQASWEITSGAAGHAAISESFSFAVFLAYPAGTVATHESTILASLEPGASLYDPNISVPRFGASTAMVAVVPPMTPLPDLVISELSEGGDIVGPGGPIGVSARVKNQGAGSALTGSVLRVQIYSGETPLGLPAYCYTLVAGATAYDSCQLSLTAPAALGAYSLRVTVDAKGTLNESDETNNARSISFTVAACEWVLPESTHVLPVVNGLLFIGWSGRAGCGRPPVQVNASWLFQDDFGGQVIIDAAMNSGGPRVGTVTVAGKTITIWQTGASCTYSLTPSTLNFSARGETRSVQVHTGAGCPWLPRFSPDAPWIAMSASPPGAVQLGPGRVDLTAAKNMGPARNGKLDIDAQFDSNVTFAQFAGNDVTPPYGVWDSPASGATGIAGAVPLSGWALDDTYVAKVQIWRDPVAGEPGAIFIGDALFVKGARPDVMTQYPNVPFNTRAGWGYMLLTNVLPGGGNGTYTFRAYAYDDAGNMTALGSKTITCSNSAAQKPFGTIDSPHPGETTSGVSYLVRGWALTPGMAKIPEDGSTISVWVDGVPKGTVNEYNLPRADVAALFPGYTNANGSFARYRLDTTKLPNGIHTIALSVRDNQNRSDGLGSRYFEVDNPAVGQAVKPGFRASLPSHEQLRLRTGYDPDSPLRSIDGQVIEVRQGERIELHLPGAAERGCLVVGNECADLPLGSTLDESVFYWQIDAAFLGEYELRFTGLQVTSVRLRVR